MKAIRLLVMLTVAVLSSASGYAYEPLVQEGLVWEKTHEEYEDNGKPYEVVNKQYFSAPVEMYGRTYHPVMYDDRVCGYMRQDGDKVYLLVDGVYISNIWYDNGNDDEFELSPGDEVMIYDFGAKEGDKYKTVYMDEYNQLYVEPQMIEIHVVKADTVMVNGHERRRLYLSPFGNWEFRDEYIAVEGVGFNIGTVHLPQYALLAGHYPYTSIFRFNSMTDAEGNVLFTGTDFNARAYQPLVQEGKTWNYDLYIDTFGDTEHQTATLKFGTPEILFGEEYFPIVDNDEYKVGYMRQTGNKIYTLVDGDIINELYPYPDGEHVLGTGEEALVCDFSASEGYKYMMSGYPKFLYDVTVTQADKILVNGIIRKRIVVTCNDIKEDGEIIFVEGIGSNKGYLCLPQFLAMVHGTGSALVFLNNVTDAEGNVIFTAADFDAPAYSAGMPEVGFDTGGTRIVDNKMYDLNGREIRNPLPGTVYILNGEKHVAK